MQIPSNVIHKKYIIWRRKSRNSKSLG